MTDMPLPACRCGHAEDDHLVIGSSRRAGDIDWACSVCACPSYRPAHPDVHHHWQTA